MADCSAAPNALLVFCVQGSVRVTCIASSSWAWMRFTLAISSRSSETSLLTCWPCSALT